MPPTGFVLETTSNGDTGVMRPAWVPDIVPVWVLEIVATLLVLVLAVGVARLLVRLFSRRIAQHLDRPSLTRVSLGSIRLGVYVFALLTVLRINGLDLGSIALSVTVFSAVVGVILAPIVGSVISGVFLLADQPYEIGDMIELTNEGRRGFVEDITLRYTKIFTIDNSFLVVPNGEMRSRDVLNYSAEDTRMRISLEIMITYESDLELAQDRIEASARKVGSVIAGGPKIRVGSARYPASPTCLIKDFADNGVLLDLRYWVEEPYRLQTVRSEVQQNVWTAFEGEDVEIAYPHTHHVFDDTSGELRVVSGANGDGTRPGNTGSHASRHGRDAVVTPTAEEHSAASQDGTDTEATEGPAPSDSE
jgi:small-conductance mechanosensitive channel